HQHQHQHQHHQLQKYLRNERNSPSPITHHIHPCMFLSPLPYRSATADLQHFFFFPLPTSHRSATLQPIEWKENKIKKKVVSVTSYY
ncbi:hypothetical protein L249_4738, partial [Ophiocordyceps polyrhachis-furcata BCC 54312]